jgi:hypothetical protein
VAIYYAAVEDDPLTSGTGGRVLVTKDVGTIQGDDGRHRRMAFIGDEAYCAACGNTGVITQGAGVSDRARMTDFVHGGRLQAVGGDFVVCKCSTHPRIVAQYGRSCSIDDSGMGHWDGDSKASTAAPVMPAPVTAHDQQFTLTDAAGNALAETYYTIRLSDGMPVHGTTDSAGRTERHSTDGMRNIAIYVGHRTNV